MTDILFHRNYLKSPMNSVKKLATFRGEYPHIPSSMYGRLILPLVLMKRGMTQVYNLLLHMLWLSFTHKQSYNVMTIFFGVIAFVMLSLLSYWGRSYDGLLLAGFLSIWVLDYVFAQSEYFHGNQRVLNILTCQSTKVIWEQRSPTQKNKWAQFQKETVSHIETIQVPIIGGEFKSVITHAWQVQVILTNGTSKFPIYQEDNAAVAYCKGETLANYFGVPFKFAYSQGQSSCATQPLDLHRLRSLETFPKTIQIRSSSQRWRIDSQWHFSSSGLLLWQVLEESGFLLFVVIVINLMICVGKVINYLYLAKIGSASLNLLIDPNFSWLSWILDDFDWLTLGEFGFTIALMVMKGAELSREEHLSLTRETLQFSLGTQLIATMPISSIIATLFVEHPQPLILILNREQAITIPGLQRPIEFRALLFKLDEAIAQLRG
jgi:hypothetical protein